MKKEISQINERNKRVELDKAWETSKTRRAIISIITYVMVVLFLYLIRAPYPFLNALIPMIGFIFSTLTLQMFKKIWIKKLYKN
ncbi:Uncharacterised protein [uncultured archaeon]|nr:Uncharacterised protein [uncultured archaeon]